MFFNFGVNFMISKYSTLAPITLLIYKDNILSYKLGYVAYLSYIITIIFWDICMLHLYVILNVESMIQGSF